MSEFESHPMLMAMAKLNLWHAQIDLGKLTVRYMEHQQRREIALCLRMICSSGIGFPDGLKEKPHRKISRFGSLFRSNW